MMLLLKILGISLLIVGHTEALFEGCDFTYNLKADSTAYLLSPYYSDKYPAGTSCRYKFIAPLDYEILAQCIIAIDKAPTSCYTTEHFYISRDGDTSLNGAEQFCGSGSISRTTQFRTLVIAYISGSPPGSNIGGTFNCTLTTRPQACDCGWTQNTRIVGGEDAALAEFPSMSAIYNTDSQSAYCGASIISHKFAVTAAHCLQNANVTKLRLLVGDYNLASNVDSPYAATYAISTYYIHAGYNATTNANDIGLIVTSTNIEWSRGVGPICLPLDQTTNTFDYTPVYLVGWGTTSFAGTRPDVLQKAYVNIIPNSACSSVYPMLLPSNVCTYADGRDACQFDSGGPVVYKGALREYLMGIISYGSECGTNPGVNTRITSYFDWIRQFPVGTLCSKPFN